MNPITKWFNLLLNRKLNLERLEKQAYDNGYRDGRALLAQAIYKAYRNGWTDCCNNKKGQDMYQLWLLQNSVWGEQEIIEAKNRRGAAAKVRERGLREGTWKLRQVEQDFLNGHRRDVLWIQNLARFGISNAKTYTLVSF